MVICFVPTELGTICMVALLPEDVGLFSSGEEGPLIELEEAMQRGIPLPKFLKIFPVQDMDEYNFVMNRWLASAGSTSTMDDFREFDQLPKLYEKDDDE